MKWVLASLLLLISLAGWSKAAPPIATKTLANGLQVWVKPDHRAPVAVFSIWYRVGSADEPAGITGISHMLEHMMFRGTKAVPDGQFNRIIAAHGGSQNAFTSSDETGYYQIMNAKDLALSFKLEADRMQHLLLQSKAFTKERQVVEEERLMRVADQPPALLREHINAVAYLNNPYRHPVIGWASDIKQYTVHDLRQWYQRWYVPNNAVIIVVGDMAPDKVFALAQQYFGAIPKRTLPKAKAFPLQVDQGRRSVKLCTKTRWQAVSLAFNVPTVANKVPSWQPYALAVLTDVLGLSESSQLNRNLVIKQQLAAGVNVSYDPLRHYGTLLRITAVPAEGVALVKLKAAILQQLDKIKTVPVTQQAMARVHAMIRAGFWYGKDSLMSQAMFLGDLVMHRLPVSDYEDYLQKMLAVTPQQLKAVAHQYLQANNMTSGWLQPCQTQEHSA